jgi:exosortase
MESKTTTKINYQEEIKRMLPAPSAQIAWIVLALVFCWTYWSSFWHLFGAWKTQEDYQHGFVVPIFAVVLLWLRRDMLQSKASSSGHLWGLPLIFLWALMRWTAVYFNYGSLPELSLLPFLAGVALFVGGWRGILWAWPAILFLIFMIPLPGSIQGIASGRLQSLATRISTYAIQTLGIPAVASGNIIQMTEEHQLNVAEACSGLRMMTLFFAICLGGAFVTRRPLWEKLVMIASAPFIALVSNAIRIILTGIFTQIGISWPNVLDLAKWHGTIHDWAGYLMMPIGLLLLLAEMTLLAKLMIEPSDRPLVAGRVMKGPGAAAPIGVFTQHRRK